MVRHLILDQAIVGSSPTSPTLKSPAKFAFRGAFLGLESRT